MLTHIPAHATFPCDARQTNTPKPSIQGLRNVDTQATPVPRMACIPLPPESAVPPETVALEQLQSIRTDMYPLGITSHLTLGQQLKLRGVKLTTPVHVHSPLAHIGIIKGVPPDQIITALDVALLLQSIVIAPLDFHTTFSQLSPDMKERVKREFLRRTNTVSREVCESIWMRFVSGGLGDNGPLGIDLLFGNGEIWGFEACSADGFSIVHVANVGSL